MDKFDTSLRFALQATGAELAEEPPVPDTPLARVLAFAAEHDEDAVTEEHIELAKQGRM
ncbi:hypothetical protein ABT001_07825 [Streptomyces sp. NPDC002793]|uniref:hypothetical protein n=1 Tax=Streptomyces sp. NPDC002793 TaxID=3154432 RepID=UPI0033211F47